MKSIDVDVAAILVRFRLGFLQHMCRDTILRWRKGAFFDGFGNLFFFGHLQNELLCETKMGLDIRTNSVIIGIDLFGYI